MEPDVIDLESGAKGLAILSAIPIVLYALWAEYYGQSLDRLKLEQPETNREVESEKVRMTTLFILLFEFTLFLGSTEIRNAYPIATQMTLILAISLLLRIQSSVEKKISPVNKKQDDLFSIVIRGALSLTMSIALYIFILSFSIKGASCLAKFFLASSSIQTVFLILGGMIGVATGLGVNFALSPFILRKILPATPLLDKKFQSDLEDIFKKVHLRSPRFWVIELEKLRLITLAIMGLSKGPQILRQSLFISRWALTALSISELKAIVSNEISHIVLKHSKKRILSTFALILLTTFFGILSVFLSKQAFSTETTFNIVGPAAAILSFLWSFRSLSNQAQKQQLEADLYCIEKLEIPFDQFTHALRKIDTILDSTLPAAQQVHPATERRILLLQSHLKKYNT